jgi:hypothetical protein
MSHPKRKYVSPGVIFEDNTKIGHVVILENRVLINKHSSKIDVVNALEERINKSRFKDELKIIILNKLIINKMELMLETYCS